MNIAFVSTYDARDIINWSGLGYYISTSLEKSGNNLKYIGNLRREYSTADFIKKVFYSKLLRKSFEFDRTVATARSYSHQVASRLKNISCDCIFSPGTLPVAFLDTKVPKVIYTDATFAGILNYYESSGGLSKDMIRQANIIEGEALKSVSLALYASSWAAESAIKFYNIDPSKIKIVPFGANIDSHYGKEDVDSFIGKRSLNVLKLLFNGVDWKRKGGDLVVATAHEIRKRGIALELHIVGITDLPLDHVPDFIINHGFLKKSVPEQKNKMEELYETCHFLFLPSNAEAFGCVYCEASAFGMPSFARNTGGVSTAITNGKNGFILNSSAGVNEYADLICHYFLDRQKYEVLALSSFHEYETRLNWNSIGNSISGLIKEIL